MNATIIVPSDKATELIEYIKKNKDNNDEIVILNDQNKDINTQLKRTIKNSKNECIILFHQLFHSFGSNYIKQIKEKWNSYNVIVCSSTQDTKLKKLNKNSIICFPKSRFKETNKKIFDIILIMRQIISMEKNIKFIDNQEYDIEQTVEKENKEKSTIKEVKDENSTRINKKKSNLNNKNNNKNNENKKRQNNKNKIQENKENVNFSNIKNRKPKILMICDVIGWAWWIKAEYLKKLLSDYYDIDIINVIGKDKKKIDTSKYDLYFTFGYSYVRDILKVPFKRRISGITAHRSNQLLQERMKKCYATHANSVLLYQELKNMHNFPFYVPNGVDTELFHEKIPVMQDHDEPIFGHVGKKGKMKNQATILEPAIEKANVKYYPHYNDYTNKISHDQMVDVHQNYDVLLIASSEDATPNSFLEASACGRMTIGNKIGNLPEFIVDGWNGILLDSWNVDDYIDAIKWCKDNLDKVYEMGQNAKETVRNYWTWELMSKNYKYMFDRILGIKRDWAEYDNPAMYHMKNYIKRN